MEDEGPVDRLSDLTDDLIYRIFFFLPSTISVSTSILAKRWRFLSPHVPDLYFDCKWDQYNSQRTEDIVNSVIIQHKSQSINTFRLSLSKGVREFALELWIKAAIWRNVKSFDLALHKQMLPLCLFTCKTLVTLSLHYSVRIPSLDNVTVSLPSLEKLHLYSVGCQTDETIPRLLSGCLSLEELIIDNVSVLGQDFSSWNISNPAVKRLTVSLPGSSKVEIHAPALCYLKLDDCWYKHFSLCPLTSLVKADICLNNDPDNPGFVFNFLNPLYDVKHLKLLSRVDNLVENTESSTPILKFDSLTKLDLDADWCFLTKFLWCADNLEDLIIRKFHGGSPKKPKHAMIWSELFERSPACMCSLRNVTFGEFRCRKQEFKMACYLMRNAKALKRVEIHFHVTSVSEDKKTKAIKRISSFAEQGPKACKVVFH